MNWVKAIVWNGGLWLFAYGVTGTWHGWRWWAVFLPMSVFIAVFLERTEK